MSKTLLFILFITFSANYCIAQDIGDTAQEIKKLRGFSEALNEKSALLNDRLAEKHLLIDSISVHIVKLEADLKAIKALNTKKQDKKKASNLEKAINARKKELKILQKDEEEAESDLQRAKQMILDIEERIRKLSEKM